MPEAVIDIHDVHKTYRRRIKALRGVSVRVERGQIVGLLGPNGAGKSTLVKILMTVVRPSRASGTVLGHAVGHKPTLRRVGYLPEHHRFPPYLTGGQVLDFYAALAGVDRSTRRVRAAELLEIVGMTEWKDTCISEYSKGMMQRVGLAQSLVNDPDLVLLDEPTDGVDPIGRRDIRDVLNRMREDGKTVLLNSHLLSELELVGCDHVLIMHQGQIRVEGSIDELTHDSRRYELVIVGDVPDWANAQPEIDVRPTAMNEPGMSMLVVSGTEASSIQPLIDRLRADARTIVRVQARRDSLEELFMRSVINRETGQVDAPGAYTGNGGGA
ncbi:MAG: ABC transporter ATP-binding protein [Phycisphaerales bacterium]|nr:ABC transporter ATP-binding protein [Phycisphaerales bacterium]